MLLLIAMLGGLLIMMGQHDRSEALFYYFRLEDQVPENHFTLRRTPRLVDDWRKIVISPIDAWPGSVGSRAKWTRFDRSG